MENQAENTTKNEALIKRIKLIKIICYGLTVAAGIAAIVLSIVFGGAGGRYLNYNKVVVGVPAMISLVMFAVTELLQMFQNLKEGETWFGEMDAFQVGLAPFLIAGVVLAIFCFSAPNYSGYQDGMFYLTNEDGTVEILASYSRDLPEELVIPQTIEGGTVTAIAEKAFKNRKITSLTVENAEVTVGKKAFYKCPNIKYANVPNAVLHQMNKKDSLETVIIRGEGTVGGLDHCYNLVSVVIEEGSAKIAGSAFYDCYKLEHVELPQSLQEIGQGAFVECRSLQSLVIPDGVTTIKGEAFSRCKALTEISLPKNLTDLNNRIFDYCTALVKINYSGTREEWDAIYKYPYWYEGLSGRKVELHCSDGNYAYKIGM